MIRRFLIAFVLLTLLLGAAGMAWTARDNAYNLVHPARSLPDERPEDVGITDYETVTFPNGAGQQLVAWYAPPGAETDGAAVIFVHGLGGNRDNLLGQAAWLVQRGYGALLLDLRNHGESEGDLTTLGLAEVDDVAAALGFLLAQPGVNPDRIGLVGHSMGGATVIRAAARLPEIDAVVAQSSYTSLEDNIAEGVRILTGLPPFPFAPLVVWFGEREAGLRIQEVRPIDDVDDLTPRPLLLVHGDADVLVPVANSRALFAAAGEPKELFVMPGAGHSGPLEAGPDSALATRLVGFLDEALRGR